MGSNPTATAGRSRSSSKDGDRFFCVRVDDVIGLAKTSGMSGIIRYNTFTHVDSRMAFGYGQDDGYYWNV